MMIGYSELCSNAGLFLAVLIAHIGNKGKLRESTITMLLAIPLLIGALGREPEGPWLFSLYIGSALATFGLGIMERREDK